MRRSENSPQLASSLMSLQSGLLSHRYSIRMQVPSPHLCSSAMQARIMGLTAREERPRIKHTPVNAQKPHTSTSSGGICSLPDASALRRMERNPDVPEPERWFGVFLLKYE